MRFNLIDNHACFYREGAQAEQVVKTIADFTLVSRRKIDKWSVLLMVNIWWVW